MSKNIDLGTFNWDISKIEQQLIENRKQIEAFSQALNTNKKALKDEQKEIQELGSQIATMKALQKDATNQLKAGTISQAQYNKTVADANTVISQNETRIREVISAQSAHIKTVMDQERAVKELRLENNELNKIMNAGRTEIVGNENAYRNLNKELNALKIESKNLGAQMLELKKAGKQNTDEYKDLEAQWKKVSSQADALNNEFKTLDKAVGDNQRSVGDYTDSIRDAFSNVPGMLASGDIKGALTSLKSGFGDLFSFIKANPIIAVLATFGVLVKQLWDYNSQVKELNTEVERVAGSSGQITDEIRKSASAIKETYGTDFKDAVSDISNLMQDFGVSASEAFKIYNEGLATGGAGNSEFGDSIREYGQLFAQNGYSAQDFINILNSGIDLKIYNDKLPDAIKEAGLSLKEQTKSTRDALVNAFGASFSDEVLNKVSTGQLTVKDALAEIADKAKDANLNQQQLAQLTADVFKGAGEDAGGALAVFEAINHAQDLNSATLTEIQEKTIELGNLNKELEEASDAAYNSDAIQSFQFEVDVLWKKLKILFADFMGWIQRADRSVQGSAAFMRGAFKSIPEAAGAAFAGVMEAFSELLKGFKAGGGAISKFFKGDFDGAKAEADSFINALPAVYSKLKKAMSSGISKISGGAGGERDSFLSGYDSRIAAGANVNRANNATGATAGTGAVADAAAKAAAERAKTESKAVADARKAAAEKQKALEAEIKKALELAKYEAEVKSDIAKNELAEYIAFNAAKLEDDKRLTAEKLANQLKYFDDLQKLQIANNTAELEKALLGQTEEEKVQIRKKFAIQEQEIVNQTNAKKRELTGEYNQQIAEDEKLIRATEFQQKLMELEANGATEYEMQRAQAEEQRTLDLAALEEQRAKELIDIELFTAKKRLIETQSAEAQKQITEAETDARLTQYSDMFGGVAKLLGENTAAGKAAGIAQATINTYQGVSDVWKTPSTLPEPFATAAKVVSTGVVLASGLGAVKRITAVQTPKAARGMLINGPSHSGGGVPISTPGGMIEAEGGEPILTKKAFQMFPRLISDINVAGGGVPLYASGGLIPSQSAMLQNSFTGKLIDYGLIRKAVAEGAAEGTYSGSQAGLGDMADNKKIQNNANF